MSSASAAGTFLAYHQELHLFTIHGGKVIFSVEYIKTQRPRGPSQLKPLSTLSHLLAAALGCVRDLMVLIATDGCARTPLI